MRPEENLRRRIERQELNPGIDNLDKLAHGVGVLSYVLLLAPEQAYPELYAAYSLSPGFDH